MPESSRCLCVAFDFEDRRKFLSTIQEFKDLDVVVKIGVRLMPYLNPDDYKMVRDMGLSYFVDAKLFDIPTQVESAVRSWVKLGASYLTIHLSAGQAVLRAAQKVASEGDLTLLGVSVLTSFDDQELQGVGVADSCQNQVRRLVKLGHQCGLRAFVSSVAEVEMIRSEVPQAFCVCPGIRLEGETQHSDQRRSFTVREAVGRGVDMLVVGRSVYQAPKPRAIVESILGELA